MSLKIGVGDGVIVGRIVKTRLPLFANFLRGIAIFVRASMLLLCIKT
jgi:hypothetical protein